MEKSVAAPKRMDQLQFFRAVGFFLIYVRHTQGTIGMNFPFLHTLALPGNQGAVFFFFILSGFLQGYLSYEKEIVLSVKAMAADFVKKLKRIYPLHLIVCLFALMGTGSFLELIDLGQTAYAHERLVAWIEQVLLVHAWDQRYCIEYNYASWFLSVLIFLTLFDVPVTRWLQNFKTKEKAPWIYGAMLLVLIGIEVVLRLNIHDYPYFNLVFPPSRVPDYLLGMVMGCFLRSIYGRMAGTFSRKLLWTVAEAAVLIFIIYNEPQRLNLSQWLMPIVLLIFVFAFGKGWISDLLRFRPLVLLGDLVFPCYILHPMVIDLVIKAYASSETPATPTGINVLFFYTLAVLLVISYIVTFVLPGKKTK